MPSVTYDGRSFMLDSRRIWLVSGSIAFARMPRELWRDRIHAAKVARSAGENSSWSAVGLVVEGWESYWSGDSSSAAGRCSRLG